MTIRTARAGVVPLTAAWAALTLVGCGAESPQAPTTAASASAEASAAASTLGDRIRSGDVQALLSSADACKATEGEAGRPLDSNQALELVDLVEALRQVYPRSASGSRAQSLKTLEAVFSRFTVDGTPRGWAQLLPPAHDLLSAGLADPDLVVRQTALEVVAGLWLWSPGAPMTPAEERSVAAWKEAFHPLVVRRLDDPETVARMVAVDCLGRLPLVEAAEPAIRLLNDPEFSVRFQVLSAFANRPEVMTNEYLIQLLNDPVPDLANLSERILQARGLDPDLIGMGKMITSSRPEVRASVVGLLEGREDIDPTIWLLRLSEDPDASVRLRAVQSLAGRTSPEVSQRLREIANADENDQVRAEAARLAPQTDGKTAALPPLPGSPSLRLKGN